MRERLKDINMGWGYNLTELDQILLSFIGQNLPGFIVNISWDQTSFIIAFDVDQLNQLLQQNVSTRGQEIKNIY